MAIRKSYKIFDIDYLMSSELSEDDLYWLFDTPSLKYSLVIDMFRRTKQELTDEKKIISLIKNDADWMYKYFWTEHQRLEFENIIKEVYKNLKGCGDLEAESLMQFWIINYGLTNKLLKHNKKIYKLCE